MRAVPGVVLGPGNGDDECVWKWLGSISSLFAQAVLLHAVGMGLAFQFHSPMDQTSLITFFFLIKKLTVQDRYLCK